MKTPAELAAKVEEAVGNPDFLDIVEGLLAVATAEAAIDEREACAKVADAVAGDCERRSKEANAREAGLSSMGAAFEAISATVVAERIRARGGW